MEDQPQHPNSSSHVPAERTNETVRTRWAPKPEQVLILESIFNSGMVNPPREETVRIRKLLEKFGAVADANVFYWFQNRRSRSRRRQRQIQASLAEAAQPTTIATGTGAIQYESSSSGVGFVPSFSPSPSPTLSLSPSDPCLLGSSSSSGGLVGNHHGGGVGDVFSFSGHMGFPEIHEQTSSLTSNFGASNNSNLHYQPSGLVTVFINGVQVEVPRGPLDMRVFGQNLVLLRSSGVPVASNDFGYSIEHLEHGENYFLVSNQGATSTTAFETSNSYGFKAPLKRY
ncbi:WUSCHEL-related homeobox 11-like [Cornus florida]|uniref:WUSCHEL-related homeobox 11-like n=1 Tax=Cornus florida TaxID=4283 RepID=UPI002899593E|nr:WUSCHEL-related homeobox 11-like [Cornus florida]